MKEDRRKNERRRWGRKVTYPFIDSDGVLVTKNRRRKVDRRENAAEEEHTDNQVQTPSSTPAPTVKQQDNKNTSIDISESKVMELEEALHDESEPASKINDSIKDLENEILDATGVGQDGASELKIEEKQEKAKPPKVNPASHKKANGKNVSIELSLKGEKHVVDANKKSCQVGRDPNCDIVVQGKFVSREHAKISIRNGKLLIEDSSYNGTYIEFENGQKIHVSKDEQALVANGVMSMGKPVDGESKSVIAFKINQ